MESINFSIFKPKLSFQFVNPIQISQGNISLLFNSFRISTQSRIKFTLVSWSRYWNIWRQQWPWFWVIHVLLSNLIIFQIQTYRPISFYSPLFQASLNFFFIFFVWIIKKDRFSLHNQWNTLLKVKNRIYTVMLGFRVKIG